MNPLVSVVIPTANGATTIRSTIESVVQQTYNNIEIVCVDNNSKDSTAKIENEFCKPINQAGGLSFQLNRGVAEAHGKYILWIDQDFTLSKDLVSKCVEACEGGQYNALVIPEIRTGSSWMQARQIEVGIYSWAGDVGARFFARDLFLAVGGMDQSLSGMRDYDLGFRMSKNGGRIGTVSASLISYSDDSLGAYVRKYFYRSATLGKIVKRHGPYLVYGPYIYFLLHLRKVAKSYGMIPFVRFVLLKVAVGVASILGIVFAGKD